MDRKSVVVLVQQRHCTRPLTLPDKGSRQGQQPSDCCQQRAKAALECCFGGPVTSASSPSSDVRHRSTKPRRFPLLKRRKLNLEWDKHRVQNTRDPQRASLKVPRSRMHDEKPVYWGPLQARKHIKYRDRDLTSHIALLMTLCRIISGERRMWETCLTKAAEMETFGLAEVGNHL